MRFLSCLCLCVHTFVFCALVWLPFLTWPAKSTQFSYYLLKNFYSSNTVKGLKVRKLTLWQPEFLTIDLTLSLFLKLGSTVVFLMRKSKLSMFCFEQIVPVEEEATYVTSRLRSQLVIPQIECFESLFVKISFYHYKHLIIGNLYRPQSAPFESTKCLLSTIISLNCPSIFDYFSGL